MKSTTCTIVIYFVVSVLFSKLFADSTIENLVELKWDSKLINIEKNSDVILVDINNCMIQAPTSIGENFKKYDPVLIANNTEYIWVSVSGISHRLAFLNYGTISNKVTDVSKEISTGCFVTIEGLEIDKEYFLYRIKENHIDPYFFYSAFGDTVISLKEKIQPGEYLLVERRNGRTVNQNLISVKPDTGQALQKFFWSIDRLQNKLPETAKNIKFIREYSEISSLCELYYKEFMNPVYSRFAYSYGQIRPADEK